MQAWQEKWKFYVPSNRELEDVVGIPAEGIFKTQSGKGLRAGQPPAWTKKKKGGHQDWYDPIESAILNMMQTVTSTEKNKIGQTLLRHWDADAAGLGRYVREISPSEAAGKNVIKVRDGDALARTGDANGVFRERYFQFVDDSILKAFTAMDEAQLNLAWRILALPANSLRWGATKISLPFVINNLRRDTLEAAMNSRSGFRPLVDSFKGAEVWLGHLMGDTKASKVVEDFIRSGGAQGLDELYSSPANYLKIYERVYSKMSRTERALNFVPDQLRAAMRGAGQVGAAPVTVPAKALEMMSEASEQATRLGEFQRARARLRQEFPQWTEEAINRRAAFEALDLLDFSQRGSNEAIRVMRQIVPFSGSSMTGLYRNMKAFRENPKVFMAKGAAFLTLPTLGYYYLIRDNPYYWEKSDDDRATNWFIPIPEFAWERLGITNPAEAFYRFPKPYLMGTMFSTVPERILQFIDQKDPKALEDLPQLIANQSTPAGAIDMLSPIGKWVAENAANWDYFRRAPIDKTYQVSGPGEVAPYLRSTEYNSLTSKLLSKALYDHAPKWMHMSPGQIDHTISSFAGGGGQNIVRGQLFGDLPGLNRYGLDPLLSAVTGEEEGKFNKKKYLGQIPTEGRHESEDRFEARLSELRQTVSTIEGGGKLTPAQVNAKRLIGRYEAAEKKLKSFYKQRANARDEQQRMPINRQIVRLTERLEPPTGRQQELRERAR